MSNITIRSYQNGDAEKIYKLINDQTEHVRNAPFWVWINRLLPLSESCTSVAEINEEIVGHYTALPYYFDFDGTKLKGALGIHALVHQEFRKDISIFQIAEKVYQQCKEKDIDFIFGFPNKNYRLIQEKIERWKRVSLFKSYCFDTSGLDSIDKYTLEIELIDEKNYGLNSIAYVISDLMERRVNKGNYLELDKDLRYYLFRYYFHPFNLYKTCWIKKEGKIEGWMAFKTYKDSKNEMIKGHLIDFIISSSVIYSEVIKLVKKYFSHYDKVDLISLWPTNEKFEESLKKEGFINSGFETYLGVKFLNSSLEEELKQEILNFNNWHLPMGDSDAF